MSRRHPLRRPDPQFRSQAQSNIKDLVTTPTCSVGNCLRRDLTSSWTSSSWLPSSPSSSLSSPSSPCCPPVSEMAQSKCASRESTCTALRLHQQNEKDTAVLKEVLMLEARDTISAFERSPCECARTEPPASSPAPTKRCGKSKLLLCRRHFLNRAIKCESLMRNSAACALTTPKMFRGL